jgi:uncharacterized membrane-anchored protein YjiN (DUF445 family)
VQEGEGIVRTIAIRVEDEEHALLTLVARVQDVTLVEVLRQAIQDHVEKVRSDPDFAAKARAILAELDREAEARRAAISGLFESEGPEIEPETGGTPSRRRNGKTS